MGSHHLVFARRRTFRVRKKLLSQFLALLAKRGHVDQAMPLDRIGLQIIEAVVVPDAVRVEIFPPLGADG